MPVQPLLHSLEGLFNVAISLQQLAHKDAHEVSGIKMLWTPPPMPLPEAFITQL